MGSLTKFIAATGVSLVLAAGGAQAADMSDAFLEPILPVEIGSAWYLRGDIGYHIATSPNATYTLTAPNTVLTNTNVSLDDAFMVGGGFGYQFNPWFRVDATADYILPGNFSANVPCTVAACGSPFSNATAEISSWATLVNAYFDLGTWAGLTPYVGGGIGAANINIKGYQSNNPPANPATLRSVASDSNSWNFAWALMAGASYAMTENALLDFNYRYLSLGDVSTNDQRANHIEVTDLDAHEFRIGFRYLID